MQAKDVRECPEYAIRPCSSFKSVKYIDPSGSIDVGLSFAAEVRDGEGAVSCWGFGYPGTGKSSYVNALAARACKELGFSWVLEVRCLTIAMHDETKAQPILREIAEYVLDSRNWPMMVFLDEIDTISRKRDDQAQRFVTETTMGLLKRMTDSNAGVECFVMGMTNHIAHCDSVVSSHIGPRIFFEPPTEAVIAAMLAAKHVPSPKKVAAAYMAICGTGHVAVHRNVSDAVNHADRTNIGSWRKKPSAELAELLFNLSVPSTAEKYNEWYGQNLTHINAAADVKKHVLLKPASVGAKPSAKHPGPRPPKTAGGAGGAKNSGRARLPKIVKPATRAAGKPKSAAVSAKSPRVKKRKGGV